MILYIKYIQPTILAVFVAKSLYDKNGRAKTQRHRLWELSTQMPLKIWFNKFTTSGEQHRKFKEFRLILFKIYRNG